MEKKKERKVEEKKKLAKFKDDYFRFYDDVKSHTHKVIDW